MKKSQNANLEFCVGCDLFKDKKEFPFSSDEEELCLVCYEKKMLEDPDAEGLSEAIRDWYLVQEIREEMERSP